MVIIKKDPIKEHDLNKEKIDDIITKAGYNICGSDIYMGDFKKGHYFYFVTCDIYGSATLFMPVAETIEKELGIEVVIYE